MTHADTPRVDAATRLTAQEATLCFSNPEAAFQLIVKLRWPDGVVCPSCGGARQSFLPTRRVWKCLACKKQFSLKVGTILEDSPISLPQWLTAVWHVANSRNRISSYKIARSLGVTQKTAWLMLRRIRSAIPEGYFDK